MPVDPLTIPASTFRCLPADEKERVRAARRAAGYAPEPLVLSGPTRADAISTTTSFRPRKVPAEALALATVGHELPPAAVGPVGWRQRLQEIPAPGTAFPSESRLQQRLLTWIDEQATTDGRFLPAKMIFAVPNAGKRTSATASRMSAEGMRAGASDLVLLLPRRGFHGLLLEMKNGPKLKPREEQAAWLDWHESHGFFCAVGRTLEEAQAILSSYL